MPFVLLHDKNFEIIQEGGNTVNYACMTDKPFVAKGKLEVKKQMSKGARSRKDFIQSHDFSVVTNPLTNEKEVKVTRKA